MEQRGDGVGMDKRRMACKRLHRACGSGYPECGRTGGGYACCLAVFYREGLRGGCASVVKCLGRVLVLPAQVICEWLAF